MNTNGNVAAPSQIPGDMDMDSPVDTMNSYNAQVWSSIDSDPATARAAIAKTELYGREDLCSKMGEFPSSAESSPGDSIFRMDLSFDEVNMTSAKRNDYCEQDSMNGRQIPDLYCGYCGINFYESCPCDEFLYREAVQFDLDFLNLDVDFESDQGSGSEKHVPIDLAPELRSPYFAESPGFPWQEDLDFDDNMNSPKIPLEEADFLVDPLDSIEYIQLDPALSSAPTYVREWIESPTEFGIQFYKLSQQGLQHPFIPPAFMSALRSSTMRKDQRRVAPTSVFFFAIFQNVYAEVMNMLKVGILVESEPGQELGHCKHAIDALKLYYTCNITRFRRTGSVGNEDGDPAVDDGSVHPLDKLFQTYPHIRSYQKQAINFAISRQGKCIFADEAGMGKRIEAIVTASHYKSEWPLLVVCGTARVPRWEKELMEIGVKQDKILAMAFHQGKVRTVNGDPEVIVVGYKALQDPEVLEELINLKAKVLILDECHRIKHYNTKATQTVKQICHFAKRCLFLTANPTHGVPQEFFQQLHFLDHQAFPNYLDFADQYCGLETTESGATVASRNWKNVKNLEELKHVLYGTVLMRHFRMENFKLPILEREKVSVEFRPTSRQKRLLGAAAYKDSCAAHAHLGFLDDYRRRTSNHRTRIFKWYKRSGIAKLVSICNYLDSVDYENEKVLIYARHKKVLEGIELFFDRRHIEFVHIEGDYAEREKSSSTFNSDSNIRVALLSSDLSNVAINLSEATFVIFGELCWVPDVLFRNENRSYELTAEKINMNRRISVKYLVAKDEDHSHIDSVLWEMLLGKMDILRKLDILRDPFCVTETTFSSTGFEEDFSDMSSDEGRGSDEYVPSDECSEDDDDEAENMDIHEVSTEEFSDLFEDVGTPSSSTGNHDFAKSYWPRVFITPLEDTELRSFLPKRQRVVSEGVTSVDLDCNDEIRSNDDDLRESDVEFIDDDGAELRWSTSSTNWTLSEGEGIMSSEESETDGYDTEEDEQESQMKKEVRKKAKGFIS